MKKVFALLLVLVYGVTSFGMTLNLHYCCGKLDKISFSSKISKTCSSTTMFHSKGCCDNKEYELKIKADQEIGSKQVIKNVSPQFVPLSFNSRDIFPAPHELLTFSSADHPPLIYSGVPLFIANCVYRV